MQIEKVKIEKYVKKCKISYFNEIYKREVLKYNYNEIKKMTKCQKMFGNVTKMIQNVKNVNR